MAMSKRERILASGVGAVVCLFAIQFVISSIRGKLDAKNKTLEQQQSTIDDLNMIENRGVFAGTRLNELKKKSLPSNPELAIPQYRNWLSDKAQESGVENILIDVITTNSTRSTAFNAYQFKLGGECRIDNLLKLLGSYYDRDQLHRIRSLKIINSSDDLDWVKFTMTTEAVSMLKAESAQPASDKSSGRLAKSIDDYQKVILGRNPFSPPNQAPKFSVASSMEVPRDKDWSLELKANDPDPAHRVKYQLVSEVPPGLRFDDKSGKLSWTPKANGSYNLVVRATDSGFPAKSTEAKLTLKVTDPPPPPAPAPEAPKFDPATQTFVSAMLNGRSGAEAWIRSKTDENTVKVSVGDQINIGSIKGKVVEVNIDKQFLGIETDGHRWTIGMGDYLEPTFKKSQEL